jgi:hypothetical protein
MACCQRQWAYGVKVNTPVTKPQLSFAVRDAKKEP